MFGLPLGQLREVCKLTRLRRVPGAPPSVAGLVNLRGEIVCALDARAILGITTPPPAGGEFLVALRGFPDPLGLVVDSIADIYAIDPAEIAPPPAEWPTARAGFFVGTAHVREGLIGLLDLFESRWRMRRRAHRRRHHPPSCQPCAASDRYTGDRSLKGATTTLTS